ncbi:hypothetical protein BDZ90DRAFT_189350 [Jaminaea rosea]|uniref:Uncharacterized protein n=1 Tax=Jaminaea rosea TaxID=1569628 RepID=A0A316UPQ9_9BASI|nr:hypothetical protein BDZ90DRAFT_189350 [Jaminaea rosea]PWN27260.1 hypothetical protein BDZ90DRAFT_189350 [Jaminaea rosea]
MVSPVSASCSCCCCYCCCYAVRGLVRGTYVSSCAPLLALAQRLPLLSSSPSSSHRISPPPLLHHTNANLTMLALPTPSLASLLALLAFVVTMLDAFMTTDIQALCARETVHCECVCVRARVPIRAKSRRADLKPLAHLTIRRTVRPPSPAPRYITLLSLTPHAARAQHASKGKAHPTYGDGGDQYAGRVSWIVRCVVRVVVCRRNEGLTCSRLILYRSLEGTSPQDMVSRRRSVAQRLSSRRCAAQLCSSSPDSAALLPGTAVIAAFPDNSAGTVRFLCAGDQVSPCPLPVSRPARCRSALRSSIPLILTIGPPYAERFAPHPARCSPLTSPLAHPSNWKNGASPSPTPPGEARA